MRTKQVTQNVNAPKIIVDTYNTCTLIFIFSITHTILSTYCTMVVMNNPSESATIRGI